MFLEWEKSLFEENEKIVILRNKKLVNYYGNIIRTCLLNNSKYAELLLDKYEIEHLSQRNTIYFPEVFTLEEYPISQKRYYLTKIL